MKKLMIATAAVALAAVAQAGIAVTNCNEKVNPECPNVVFKVTASGKIVDGLSKEYKTVSKLKVSKGALVLWGTGSADCCYDVYSLYLPVKFGKQTVKVLIPQEELDCWTIFGKNMDAALEGGAKNKKYKLESEIGLSYADAGVDGDTLDDLVDGELTFIATAVGKATYKYTAESAKKSACSTGCEPASYDVVPGSYSGWFAGFYPAWGEELCLTCGCNELDVYGGTWKAKYDAKLSTKGGWRQAASYAFGSSTAALMAAEEVE